MKLNYVTIFILTFLSLLTSGCEDVDVMLVTEAGMDAVKALALSEEDVRNLAIQTAQFSDSQNKIAARENSYSQRLKKLTYQHTLQDGFVFDFKVYETPEVNAFAGEKKS